MEQDRHGMEILGALSKDRTSPTSSCSESTDRSRFEVNVVYDETERTTFGVRYGEKTTILEHTSLAVLLIISISLRK